MKKFLALLLLTGLITSCGKTNKQDENKADNAVSINFVSKEYNKTEEGVTGKIAIPFAEGETATAKAINEKIYSTLKSVILIKSTATTYEELLDAFAADYQGLKKEFPSSAIGYDITVEGSVELNNANLICIELDTYLFTGGAHGIPYTYALLFDGQTGKELAINDVISDIPAFTKVAEANFRKTFEIATDAKITSTGFTFENDTFALPSTILFNDHNVILHYNHYEIASYAEGDKEVSIPLEEVKDLLKIKL